MMRAERMTVSFSAMLMIRWLSTEMRESADMGSAACRWQARQVSWVDTANILRRTMLPSEYAAAESVADLHVIDHACVRQSPLCAPRRVRLRSLLDAVDGTGKTRDHNFSGAARKSSSMRTTTARSEGVNPRARRWYCR